MKTECPFCRKMVDDQDACQHFIGWTEDGRTIEPRKNIHQPMVAANAVLETDIVKATGVSCRVFRDVMFS